MISRYIVISRTFRYLPKVSFNFGSGQRQLSANIACLLRYDKRDENRPGYNHAEA